MFNQFFGEEGSKRISKWTVILLASLSVFLIVKIIADFKKLSYIGREIYPQSTIIVSGKGESYAIPDTATFDFTVTEVGNTVKQAQEKLDQKINQALSSVRAAGIADKDIKTVSYNVYPKYEYQNAVCPAVPMGAGYSGVTSSPTSPYYCPPGKNVLKGYEVSQTVVIKVRETEKAADLVTKIGAASISNISSLEFTVDDRDKYVVEARAEAINKAKAQAKVLADQLGVRLGKILAFNENGNYPIYYGMEGKGGDMMTASAAPARAELPQGETKITSDISITYEIR